MACENENCDGEWHECWDCGGEGYVYDEDENEEYGCETCHGDGGWACPKPLEGAE